MQRGKDRQNRIVAFVSVGWLEAGLRPEPRHDWAAVSARFFDGARRELGTRTIKNTVNLALRRAGARRREDVRRQLDLLAQADLAPRDQAWR